MNSKNHNNMFRFSLHQGNVKNTERENGTIETTFNEEVLLCENTFDADVFNPFTRYSIDIRDILPSCITQIQKILSRKRYDVEVYVGEGKEYDLLKYHTNMLNTYPKEWREGIKYNPKSQRQAIETKVIKGVPCKIGLYINNNPIVERVFYVDGFNPIARYSVDVTDTVHDIVNDIYNRIKDDDVSNMWDDYNLINRRGLSISQIRELSPGKRAYLLRCLN